MIRCIAIDDEPLALSQIADYIRKTSFLELAGQFESAVQTKEMLSKTNVDLMFVDIDMPGMNGMEFVKNLENPPGIVFVTAHSEYALEGFSVNAIDFLLKPVSYSDFLKSANKVKSYFDTTVPHSSGNKSEKECLFVKSGYKIVRIRLSDIMFIQGMREYVSIRLSNGKSYMSPVSLHVLEGQLPSDKFMRVHRSYIVNLNKIITVDSSRIILDEKVYVPVSGQYKKQFLNYINSNSLG